MHHILTGMNAEVAIEEDKEQEKLSRGAHYIHAFFFPWGTLALLYSV